MNSGISRTSDTPGLPMSKVQRAKHQGHLRVFQVSEYRSVGGLGGLAGVARPVAGPSELPVRPITVAHQRKREAVLSAFGAILNRTHPYRLARGALTALSTRRMALTN